MSFTLDPSAYIDLSLPSIADVCPPFHLHTELAYQIKAALNSKSQTDPEVRIELQFDKFLFTGVLQQCERKLKEQRGHTVYGIRSYGSLAPLLGNRWHIRVLNNQMDFCYALLESVRFHLHHRKAIPDLQPDSSSQSVHGGVVLVFHFVHMDCVRMEWEEVFSIL